MMIGSTSQTEEASTSILFLLIEIIRKRVIPMVNEGKGRLFKRKDGKYLIYIPVDLAEDSMFPFKNYKPTKRGTMSIPVKISFSRQNPNDLLIQRHE